MQILALASVQVSTTTQALTTTLTHSHAMIHPHHVLSGSESDSYSMDFVGGHSLIHILALAIAGVSATQAQDFTHVHTRL